MVLTVFNVRGRQNSALPGLTSDINEERRKAEYGILKLSLQITIQCDNWAAVTGMAKKKLLLASRQLMYTVGDKEEEGGTEKQVNIRWKTPYTAFNSGELKFHNSTSTLPCLAIGSILVFR